LHEILDEWREEKRNIREARPEEPSLASDGAGQPLVLHEFQEGFLKLVLALRGQDLPPGQP
jgi:hypothetical protein